MRRCWRLIPQNGIGIYRWELVVLYSLEVSEPDLCCWVCSLEDLCTHQGGSCHQREEQEHGEVVGAKICVGKIDEGRDADGKHTECAEYSGGDSDEPCHSY